MAIGMRRFRKRVVLLFVGAALGIPALVLSLLSIKLVRDFADIGNTVRREYGEYVAGIAARAVEESYLDREQFNMVAARFVPPETPGEVLGFLNRFQLENPFYLLSFFVVPEGLVHYSELDRGRSAAFRPIPEWIQNAILATVSRQTGIPSGLQHLSGEGPDGPVQVTYFTLHGQDGRTLGAAGFIWNLEQVRDDTGSFERALGEGLRDTDNLFRGAFFEAPVVVAVRDQERRDFFRTGPPGPVIATKGFSRVLPFYEIAVSLPDDRFQAWIDTVVWTSSIMVAAMFLVIVLALVFSLRFVLHEIELAELKSNFVGNVSHELKTPLALIRLFSETLEMGRAGSPEKEKEFLRIIGKESQRLTHLINNVLDVGRIEEGRKTYRFAPVDLKALVEETLDAYSYSLEKQGFTVETDLADDVPPFSADADAITQALINLMENAIKYSTESRFLRVELSRRRDQAVLRVIDRGIGIPPDEQRRIFEKFYRVERGLVHNVKGSGLGLALVRHIVEAHGGRIAVQSRPGEGSAFSIQLPLQRPRDRSARPVTDANEPGGPEP